MSGEISMRSRPKIVHFFFQGQIKKTVNSHILIKSVKKRCYYTPQLILRCAIIRVLVISYSSEVSEKLTIFFPENLKKIVVLGNSFETRNTQQIKKEVILKQVNIYKGKEKSCNN
jgi:hypothetical protein